MNQEIRNQVSSLYEQSSKLRALAKIFSSPVSMDQDEAAGLGNILQGIADEIDSCRDRLHESNK